MKIIEDLKAYSKFNNPVAVLLASKGFHAMCCYRLGVLLAKTRIFTFVSFIFSRLIQILYGIDIHWGAEIDGGCRIVHGYSLVIAKGVVIGKNCTLYQEVTLGSKGEWTPAGLPVIGDNVKIYAGAKVLGPVKIAAQVSIGANAVVTKDCPQAKATYAGIPAKLIK